MIALQAASTNCSRRLARMRWRVADLALKLAFYSAHGPGVYPDPAGNLTRLSVTESRAITSSRSRSLSRAQRLRLRLRLRGTNPSSIDELGCEDSRSSPACA